MKFLYFPLKLNTGRFFYLIFLLVLLVGCSEKNILSADKKERIVSIKSSEELLVSSDMNLDTQLVANRKLVNDWERFKIERRNESEFVIQAANKKYISADTTRGGLLVANSSIVTKSQQFKFIPVEENKFKIQDNVGNYVGLDKRNNLHANKKNLFEAEVFEIKEIHKNKFSYFSLSQLIFLISGLTFVFISILLFQYKENAKYSILFLLGGGFLIRFFMIMLDPYLNIWDEQFHALVAKNMIHFPFKPMLYANAVLPFWDNSWIFGDIWLHKQPLFLWQMALSMKIFGVNTIAMRLPSALMSTVVIYFIYRIGKIAINKQVGFYGAVLFAMSYFTLEMVSGYYHTDHNDIAFLFYMAASIWSWVEYENASGKRKRNFLIAIGVFAGCAVLVKWLTGLLVYSGWGLTILAIKEKRIVKRNYTDILIAFFISVVIFLPWQFYIFSAFPEVSRMEYKHMSSHFNEVIEGHGGTAMYHLTIANLLYGISYIFILIALLAWWPSFKNKVYRIALFTYVIAVYLFFTIAATKMIAFTYCISFLVFLSFGNLLDKYFKIFILNKEYLSKKIYNVLYTTVVLAVVAVLTLRIETIQENHTLWKKTESDFNVFRERDTKIIKKLKTLFPDINEYVLFNTKLEDKIPAMFFTDVIAAYSDIPDYDKYKSLSDRKIKMIIFDNGSLPDYLMKDTRVKKVDLGYWD